MHQALGREGARGETSEFHFQLPETWKRELRYFFCWCLVFPLWLTMTQAQDGSSDPATRADEIQAERLQKASSLEPEILTPNERRLIQGKKIAERLFRDHNPHLRVGGLPTGSGFAAGPVFEWTNSTDQIRGYAYGVGSIYRYYRAGTGLEFPRLGTRSLALSLDGAHADSPRLDFYGSGPNSTKSGRTDYRREDTSGDLTLRWDPWHEHVIMNAEAGGLFVNVGPGTRGDLRSTESVYSPSQAPGVDVQTNFFRAGSSIDFDFRDFKDDPHKGGRLFLGYEHYRDFKYDRFSFNRVVGDTQFYIPFLNEKRVIALRARTEFTYPDRNQVVPFYMQPVLGVSGDFRGFRPYRFQDDALVLLNAEYRWEVNSGFDMALFADAGRVFDRPRLMNLSQLEHSAGIGLRFKNRERVVMRIDTGFSREGVQLWLKFDNVF